LNIKLCKVTKVASVKTHYCKITLKQLEILFEFSLFFATCTCTCTLLQLRQVLDICLVLAKQGSLHLILICELWIKGIIGSLTWNTAVLVDEE